MVWRARYAAAHSVEGGGEGEGGGGGAFPHPPPKKGGEASNTTERIPSNVFKIYEGKLTGDEHPTYAEEKTAIGQ